MDTEFLPLPTDPQGDLFDVLNRIVDTLSTGSYEFVNLSIGPYLPIEDNEVHVWTAKLDELLADGKILTTIAVGNSGDSDRESGNARVQVPSDCVNALAVGAADSRSEIWRRAYYSSLGPGRSPGVVKPDLISFGGAGDEPFYVLHPSKPGVAAPSAGTSLSSPSTLRLALGLKAHFGSNLTPLALKALLVHHTDPAKLPKEEIGWGRTNESIEEVVTCPTGVAKIIYQGFLEPSKFLRAEIPMLSGIDGRVEIKATFCFASAVNPQDPANYTRSGLEITFRPHSERHAEEDSTNAESKTFFSQRALYTTEMELRRDAHKWETVLHAKKGFLGTSLENPVFDIHYNARDGVKKAKMAEKIPYALIISVSAKNEPELYDKIVNKYRTQLEIIEPVIEIPVRV